MPYQRVRTAIGHRRERVSLQTPTTISDGMGGQRVTGWATVAQPWASIVPLDQRDQEAIRGNQITVLHAYHFDIRYRSGVVPVSTMRVLWRDKTLQISTVVDDDAMKRRLVVQCAEVQGTT